MTSGVLAFTSLSLCFLMLKTELTFFISQPISSTLNYRTTEVNVTKVKRASWANKTLRAQRPGFEGQVDSRG